MAKSRSQLQNRLDLFSLYELQSVYRVLSKEYWRRNSDITHKMGMVLFHLESQDMEAANADLLRMNDKQTKLEQVAELTDIMRTKE